MEKKKIKGKRQQNFEISISYVKWRFCATSLTILNSLNLQLQSR